MATVTGKEALIDLMVKEGVEYVFGNPGATEIVFMDELEKETSIKYRLGLQEIVCAGMAEGYAKASGKPAFLNLHTAPGLAAAMPMIYNAYTGGVPLVITVGQQDTRLLQYDPHLTGDIVGMGKLHTKWSTEIFHADDIPTVMQRAFKMAVQHPMGPVLVSIPQNVLEQELDYDYKPNTTVFRRTRPDKRAVEAAVKILKSAEKPVLFVESGVSRSDAVEEVVHFAELIGASVYQSWMSDVNFPVNHPQYLGDLDPTTPMATETLRDNDVIIGIGCSMFAQGFYEPEKGLPGKAKIIQINQNPWEIGKNFPADCGLEGDISASLKELSEAIQNEMSLDWRDAAYSRIAEITERKHEMGDRLREQITNEWDNRPISISRLMAEIRDIVDSDSIVVDDSWTSSAMLRSSLGFSRPRSYFRSRKGGSIGSGLPSALGVQIAQPNKKVICVSGDGSAAWSMQSLWTAAKYNIPVTYVITNNAVYRQVKVVRSVVLGDYPLDEKHVGMELDQPVIDFAGLARSLGVKSESVKDPEDLNRVLKEASEANEPRLVEVFVENKA